MHCMECGAMGPEMLNGKDVATEDDAIAAWNRRAALAAAPSAGKVKRNREADRIRFPDPQFNRWLDEGVSDAHTVWDVIGDTAAAWSAWGSRPYYDAPSAAQEPEVHIYSPRYAHAPSAAPGDTQPVGWLYGSSFWHATNPRITDEVRKLGRPLYAAAPAAPSGARHAIPCAQDATVCSTPAYCHANGCDKAAPSGAQKAMTPEEAFALREQNTWLVELYDAVKNLIKVKGRHHTENAYQRVVAAFEKAQRG